MKRVVGLALTLALIATSTSAWASAVSYGDVAADDVTYVNIKENSGTDPEDLPLYGDPSAAGNSLVFSPSNYVASAEPSEGEFDTDNTSATLTMQVVSNSDLPLASINIMEFGDTFLAGLGEAQALTAVAGGLFVSYDDGNGLQTLPVGELSDVSFSLPDDSGLSEWTASVEINLAELNVTEVFVSFDNLVTAIAEEGATAFIEKKVFKITTTVVPEPASVALIGLGALLIAGRRRIDA